VECLETDKGERYVLVDNVGDLIYPIVKYLKYKDNTGSARSTLRRISYNLKLYFEFLEQKSKTFEEVDIDIMAEFVTWLKNPLY
jgi:integrase/recombinase XerD